MNVSLADECFPEIHSICTFEHSCTPRISINCVKSTSICIQHLAEKKTFRSNVHHEFADLFTQKNVCVNGKWILTVS